MDFRLLVPLSFWTDVDPGPEVPLPDPDRPPTVHLPAGAVLRDVEVEPADPSVGIFNDSVIGTHEGKLIGWFGPGAVHLFDEVPPLTVDSQIDVTLSAAAAVALRLRRDRRDWAVNVELGTRHSTPVVEIAAFHNAAAVTDGDDPEGFYAWWHPGHGIRPQGYWAIDTTDGLYDALYDADHDDHPADGLIVAAAALRLLGFLD